MSLKSDILKPESAPIVERAKSHAMRNHCPPCDSVVALDGFTYNCLMAMVLVALEYLSIPDPPKPDEFRFDSEVRPE